MREHLYDFSPEVALRMETLMPVAKSAMALRRIQAIYFRARYGEMAEAISERIGLKVQSIRNLHSAWLRKGEAVLATGNKGGRYREHLTLEQERALIESHRVKAEKGGILEVSLIHGAYEAMVGKEVAKSTVYRMLHRHGWRKIAPRPRHPKADREAQEAFKKTGRDLSKKRGKKPIP
jgi:transposase